MSVVSSVSGCICMELMYTLLWRTEVLQIFLVTIS